MTTNNQQPHNNHTTPTDPSPALMAAFKQSLLQGMISETLTDVTLRQKQKEIELERLLADQLVSRAENMEAVLKAAQSLAQAGASLGEALVQQATHTNPVMTSVLTTERETQAMLQAQGRIPPPETPAPEPEPEPVTNGTTSEPKPAKPPRRKGKNK